MKTAYMDEIVFKLKKCDNCAPGAIAFIGAGCSFSAGIPLANGMVKDIVKEYGSLTKFRDFTESSDYSDVMDCLDASDRRDIIKKYVNNAEISITYIYLANLIAKGYIDYIVTVNFDNLLQKALALYNIIPAAYDISILKADDIDTLNFEKQSIIYLHGQFNGLWQLNTKEEMERVKKESIAQKIFSKISDRRPWIVIGYSGNDYIFDQLASMNRFASGLFWITYLDKNPEQNVLKKLLEKDNSGAVLVKGFDSDSFFYTLNTDLNLDTPEILKNPFQFLSKLITSVKNINEEKFSPIKIMLQNIKESVNDALNRYDSSFNMEEKDNDSEMENKKIEKELIDLTVNKKFEEFEKLTNDIREPRATELNEIIALGYAFWGDVLADMADTKPGDKKEEILNIAVEKYQKASELKPGDGAIYKNWGTALYSISEMKEGEAKEKKLKEAVEKYQKASELKPGDGAIYNNWGIALFKISEMKEGEAKEKKLKEAVEKYQKASELKPGDGDIYIVWGIALYSISEMKEGEAKEKKLKEAVEKYQKASELKPGDGNIYNNWGAALLKLSVLKPENEKESCLNEAFDKFRISVELGETSGYYNMACALALSKEFEKAFVQLEVCLKENYTEFAFVEEDKDWEGLRGEPEYLRLKEVYSKKED
jgi:Tfp pilus assembly protein PilF/NAD-dependent SIR2 family protein deacetylase